MFKNRILQEHWMFDHLEWGQTPSPCLIFLVVVLSGRPRRKAGVPALTALCEEGPPIHRSMCPPQRVV